MTIDHEKKVRTLSISMPGSIERMAKALNLVKLNHSTKLPINYVPPHYFSGPQMEQFEDDSAPLSEKEANFIQQVVGRIRYYAEGVDSTNIVSINRITSEQAKPTANTLKAI